jgi:protein TonB
MPETPTNRCETSPGGLDSCAPRLELAREKRWKSLRGDFLALLRGPRPMQGAGGDPFFRDCQVTAPAPRRALAASALWHVAFVVLAVPLSRYVPAPQAAAPAQMELAWYGPINDLPMILPAARSAPRPRSVSKAEEPVPPRGADGFDPRQTILNSPMRPNHPRQTLIQTEAPPEPPKILLSLPNIVELDVPTEPQLRIDEALLALRRPKATAPARSREIVSPELPDLERMPGPIDFVMSEAAKPALPLSPMSAPRAAVQRSISVAAPDMRAADSESAQLIALSATPAPDRPPEIPPGNLSARLAISPEGAAPAAPGQGPDPAPSGAGTGPAGLSISGGRAPASSTSGGGVRIMPGTPGRPAASPGVVAGNTQPRSLLDRLQPGMPPEGLLGPKRIYKLQVSMPNFASATGSWVLSFAEMFPIAVESPGSAAPAGLSGPEPLLKVDPKYPPELRSRHVEGEVILYAVIRGNGAVDSIQLLRGLEPRLDANAMQAFALWKFRPAERQGAPVEIEAVVRIPFRAVAPAY